jgi:hypothetical protein
VARLGLVLAARAALARAGALARVGALARSLLSARARAGRKKGARLRKRSAGRLALVHRPRRAA